MSEMIPVLELQDVWLRIPVDSRETRTLNKALLRSVTGGAIKRTTGGAEIEAISASSDVASQSAFDL